MQPDDIRFLYAYDRWATRRVLAVLDDLDPEVWSRPNVVGERGLGGILVHHLGATQRWRIGFQSQWEDEGPSPELEPLPTVRELRDQWDAEWAATDGWLPTLTDGFISHDVEGVPVWHMLVHVMNHGTQHRSEAALLLTAEGRSPGDLDLIDYTDELAASARPPSPAADAPGVG